jgi:hypothetical protein
MHGKTLEEDSTSIYLIEIESENDYFSESLLNTKISFTIVVGEPQLILESEGNNPCQEVLTSSCRQLINV